MIGLRHTRPSLNSGTGEFRVILEIFSQNTGTMITLALALALYDHL